MESAIFAVLTFMSERTCLLCTHWESRKRHFGSRTSCHNDRVDLLYRPTCQNEAHIHAKLRRPLPSVCLHPNRYTRALGPAAMEDPRQWTVSKAIKAGEYTIVNVATGRCLTANSTLRYTVAALSFVECYIFAYILSILALLTLTLICKNIHSPLHCACIYRQRRCTRGHSHSMQWIKRVPVVAI